MSITKSLYALAGTLMVAENTFAAAATDYFGANRAERLNTAGADPYAAITGTIVKLLSLSGHLGLNLWFLKNALSLFRCGH